MGETLLTANKNQSDKIRTGNRSDRPNIRVSLGTHTSPQTSVALWPVATARASEFVSESPVIN